MERRMKFGLNFKLKCLVSNSQTMELGTCGMIGVTWATKMRMGTDRIGCRFAASFRIAASRSHSF